MNNNKLMIFEKKIEKNDDDFFNFLKEYEDIENTKISRVDINHVVIIEVIFLILAEIFIYYKDLENAVKFMTMAMIFCLGIMIFGQEILKLLNNFSNKRLFEEKSITVKNKKEYWLNHLKEKEKRYEMAKDMLKRIEKIENKIDKEDLVKLENTKKNIYKTFSKEISVEDFSSILNYLEKINYLEKMEQRLEKEKEEFLKIKNEIDGVKTVNLSNTFTNNKKSFK